MTSTPEQQDPQRTRMEGEAFGRSVAKRIALQMTRATLSDSELRAIGSEGVSLVLAKAQSLADAGLDQTTLDEWTNAAAEAFNRELERAASLLVANQASDSRH